MSTRPRHVAVLLSALALVSMAGVGCTSNADEAASSTVVPSLSIPDDTLVTCTWASAGPQNINPPAALAPTTTAPGDVANGDASMSAGDDQPITPSSGGPVTIYFQAASMDEATATAEHWEDIDVSGPDALGDGPGPWDLDSLLVITGKMPAAAVEALPAPPTETCLDQIVEQVRPEVVDLLAQMPPSSFEAVGEEWAAFGVQWFGHGGDNAEGLASLAALMSRAEAAHHNVYVVLTP